MTGEMNAVPENCIQPVQAKPRATPSGNQTAGGELNDQTASQYIILITFKPAGYLRQLLQLRRQSAICCRRNSRRSRRCRQALGEVVEAVGQQGVSLPHVGQPAMGDTKQNPGRYE